VPDDRENSPDNQAVEMRIPVLASAFYNESLLILLGIALGIILAGTAMVMSLGFGPADTGLNEARATILAGSIQGVMTLLAGFAAIGAAAVAYKGALRQVSLAESQHNAWVTAYRIKLLLVTENLRTLTVREYIRASGNLARYRRSRGKYPLKVRLFEEPTEFSESDLKNHALLGEEVVQEIHRCRTELRHLIRFQREVIEHSLSVDTISNFPTTYEIPAYHVDENGETFEYLEDIEEKVVEENVTRTNDFFKTVDMLLFLLKPGHEVQKCDLKDLGNTPDIAAP
jgi:hypothetical protein